MDPDWISPSSTGVCGGKGMELVFPKGVCAISSYDGLRLRRTPVVPVGVSSATLPIYPCALFAVYLICMNFSADSGSVGSSCDPKTQRSYRMFRVTATRTTSLTQRFQLSLGKRAVIV